MMVIVKQPKGETMTTQQKQQIQKYLGPQQVGGHYHCGYWNKSYTIEHIGISDESRIPWSDWSMTVRWDDDGHTGTHCTAWDPKRDRVL